MRHFLTLKDFTKDEILEMIALAQKIKAETKAKSIVVDAEEEAKLLAEKVAEKNEVALTHLEKQAVEKQALSSKKATQSTIDNLLNDGFDNDDIAVDDAKVVSLVSGKVA